MSASTPEAVTHLLLTHRQALFAYLFAIVRDYHAAEDLFQETSLVIVQRWREFGAVQDFWSLAREIARRQALASLRKRSRAPLLLSPEGLDALDRGFEALGAGTDARMEALAGCVKRLPEAWASLVRLRFWSDLSVAEIATQSNRSPNTVSVTLNRIRAKLAECVRQKMGLEEAR